MAEAAAGSLKEQKALGGGSGLLILASLVSTLFLAPPL